MRASKLITQLTIYYAVIGLLVWVAVSLWPDFRGYLPIGGVESLITQPNQNPLQGTDAIRAEHVGSFLRPQRLIEAARAHKAGTLDAAGFAKVQDDCVRQVVAFQENIGLRSITDGEFRRRGWSAGFIDSVEGFGLRDGTLGFRTETKIVGVASSPYARAKLKRKHRIIADDYKFLKTAVKKVPDQSRAQPWVCGSTQQSSPSGAATSSTSMSASRISIWSRSSRLVTR